MTVTSDNGVNVQALLDAREALKGAPEAAQFTWRATSQWQNGVHTQIKVQPFFGLGEDGVGTARFGLCCGDEFERGFHRLGRGDERGVIIFCR